MGNKYVDHDGRLMFVRAGLGGDTFMTMYQKPGHHGGGGAHRLTSKHLPHRNTIEEAQADLDQYATAKGWRKKAEVE